MEKNNQKSITKSFNRAFKIIVGTAGTGILLAVASHTSLLNSFKDQATDTAATKKPVKRVVSDSLSKRGPAQR